MKKILLFAFLATHASAHAADLLTAIQETDLVKVNQLLENQSLVLNGNAVTIYVTLAAEAVHMRRDTLLNARILASMGKQAFFEELPEEELYRIGLVASAVGVLGSTFCMLFLTQEVIDLKLGMAVSFTSLIAMCYCQCKINAIKLNYLEKRYKDALIIYNVIYEKTFYEKPLITGS